MLHEILGQPDPKLAVYNGLQPVADALSYFGGINLTFYIRMVNKTTMTSINPFPT